MIDGEELKTRIIEAYNHLNSQFSKGQIVAITLLVSFLVLGGGVLYLKSRPQPVKIESVKTAKPNKSERPRKLEQVIVHVAGAVNKPDVYELKKGSRIIQAINEAGGAVSEADLNALNLAAKLIDGQRIYVPRKGEAPPPAQTLASGSTGSAPLTDASSALINLNTAPPEQLEELPGVGPVLAQRIIEQRAKRRFSKVDELQEVEGIGPKKFSQIKDKAMVD